MLAPFPTDVFVIIEGEPYLSRAQNYQRQRLTAHTAWIAFAKLYGATHYISVNKLIALQFDSKAPIGWKKVRSKEGNAWAPKVDTEDHRQMMLLPEVPESESVFGTDIVRDISYTCPVGGYGSGGVGNYFSFWLGWIGDTIVGRIPHAGNAARNHLRDHPGDTVCDAALNFKVPAGLREISKAQYDLMVAQFRVDRETKEKVDA